MNAILAAAATLFALPALAVQLPIRTYTTADGLLRNAAHCVLSDRKGFIWFCTAEGLSRFDGKNFDNFGVAQGLPDRHVKALVETRSGMLLAATNAGLSRLDSAAAPGSDHQFVTIPRKDGSPTGTIYALIEDPSSGVVWAGALYGLYRLDQPGSPKAALDYISLPGQAPISFASDQHGGLWMGTSNSIGYRSAEGRIEWVVKDLFLANALLFDKQQQRLWVGTLNGLFLMRTGVRPGTLEPVQRFSQKDGLGSERIQELFRASTGTLWAGTATGLSELAADNRFQSYGAAEGIHGRAVSAIAESKDGSLWIAADHGVGRIARDGFLRYLASDGIGDIAISSLLEDRQGRLIAISNELGGPVLHLSKGSKFEAIRPAYPSTITGSGSGVDQIAVIAGNGEWWFATSGGIVRFPAVRAEDLPHTAPIKLYNSANKNSAGDDVSRLFQDSSGGVWAAAGNTLLRWNRTSNTFRSYSNPSDNNYPSCFAEDRDGTVWIGSSTSSESNGRTRLLRFRKGRLDPLEGENLPAGWIFQIFFDHTGRLWVGSSDGGLARADHPSADRLQFIRYTAKDGLSGPAVSAIAEDRWGRIHATTAHGVDVLNPDTGAFQHLSIQGVLPTEGMNSVRADRQGRLWFASTMGLASFIPVLEPQNPPPPAVIKRFTVNNTSRAFGTSLLNLSPNENQLRFDCAAPGSNLDDPVRFQYRLTGADPDWNPPTAERTVNYSNLPPGSYQFQVRAVSGAAAGLPSLVAFEILRHFWQRWWFLTGLALALALMAYALHKYDVRRRLEVELFRARIAADLHDDLGASLSRVAILSEVARRKTKIADPETDQRLGELANTARGLVDGMSDMVWSIDPERDDLGSLLTRVRQFAANLLDPAGIRWTFDASDNIDNLKLSPDQRWQLFLILKEALHNAARHSGCKSVEMSFEASEGRYSLRIEDDGAGFHAATNGNGLGNMRKRAAALGGELEIHSNPGAGVAVVLRAPLRA